MLSKKKLFRPIQRFLTDFEAKFVAMWYFNPVNNKKTNKLFQVSMKSGISVFSPSLYIYIRVGLKIHFTLFSIFQVHCLSSSQQKSTSILSFFYCSLIILNRIITLKKNVCSDSQTHIFNNNCSIIQISMSMINCASFYPTIISMD